MLKFAIIPQMCSAKVQQQQQRWRVLNEMEFAAGVVTSGRMK